ncbi:NADPH-dependent F420 reductase [Leifsonia sp. Le1]|uniref:NADPH-dependent F420 reductase n=1 Tax=Leifsonia sp. Le1 TaxID=3404918 RepID=UPI003EBE4AC5
MRVGLLGTGPMTRAVGARLVRAGHTAVIGSRDEQRAAAVARDIGGDAHGTGYRDAAACEVVIVAVHDPVAIDVVAGLGEVLDGAVLIDLGNPLDPPHWESRHAGGPSLAERIADAAPGARVVKAFNTVYAELLALPSPVGAEPPQTFIASDDAEAAALVIALARELGTAPVDVGPLRMARHLEAVAGFEVAMVASGFAAAVATRLSAVPPV